MTEQSSSLEQLAESVGERTSRALSDLTTVSASDVFGAPVEVGERTVITAATIQRGGGFGFGAGGDEKEDGNDGGVGAGLGGGAEGRPVAVIEITSSGVVVRPVLDFTKVGLAVLTAFVGLVRGGRGRRGGHGRRGRHSH